MKSKTIKQIEQMIITAMDCDDGHYYDRDECWYCGKIDGIKFALLWVLGLAELTKVNENGSNRLKVKTFTDETEFYRRHKIKGVTKWLKN